MSKGIARATAGLFAACVLGVASTAAAGDNDFRLNGRKDGQGILYSCETQDSGGECLRFVPRQAGFRDFATQLGLVMAPRMAAPALTLGYGGFHLSAMWNGSFVSSDADYWLLTERGQRTRTAASMLSTLQLDVRKGLPFSFEVGTNFMWLVGSELFAPGLEVRWALNEGAAHLPDLSFRGAVNHLVGSRDLLLTTIGLDAMLSKSFGLFGMVNVTPYLGWSVLMIAANSRVIDPTPAIESDIINNLVFQRISPTSRLQHRLTFGVRTIYHVLNLSVQGDVQMLGEYEQGGAVGTLSTKLGLDF